MKIHRIEYILLDVAFKYFVSLKNIAADYRISYLEIAAGANRLFKNGDIIGIKINDVNGEMEEEENFPLTLENIKANLDGQLDFLYKLTPQGGARWEFLCNPNWNKYYGYGIVSGFSNDDDNYKERKIICTDKQMIENLIDFDCNYDESEIPLWESFIWDILEPWQATYWKTLPKAYQLQYKYRYGNSKVLDMDSLEWKKKNQQINNRFGENWLEWHTEPKLDQFDSNPNNLFEGIDIPYLTHIPSKSNPKIEYLILKRAVIDTFSCLSGVAYSDHISHGEIAIAANSLFEKGDIRAKLFMDGSRLGEGIPDVFLTIEGIKDHLDKRLNIIYYLTSQGGERWEAMANPDWDKFFVENHRGFLPYYKEGIIATNKKIIENILNLDCFLFSHLHIRGTEIWQELKPFPITYWKTLPKGYHVSYQSQDNPVDYYDESQKFSAKEIEAYEQACEYYEEIKKWYADPDFD